MSAPNTVRNGFTSYKELTLTASAISQPVAVTGSQFLCTESNLPFQMKYRDEWFTMRIGMGFRLPDGERFTELVFKNDNAEDVTIKFYVGNDQAIFVPVIQQPTLVYGQYNTGQKVTNSTFIASTGTYGGRRRKQIILANYGSERAHIYAVSGGATQLIGAVFPQSSWTIETDKPIWVYGVSAGGTWIIMGEVFYEK